MFSEIRNEHFSNVFGFLSQKARNLQTAYDVSECWYCLAIIAPVARFRESLYDTTLKNGIYICIGALRVNYLVVVFYVRCQPIETNKMLLRLRSLFRSANIDLAPGICWSDVCESLSWRFDAIIVIVSKTTTKKYLEIGQRIWRCWTPRSSRGLCWCDV